LSFPLTTADFCLFWMKASLLFFGEDHPLRGADQDAAVTGAVAGGSGRTVHVPRVRDFCTVAAFFLKRAEFLPAMRQLQVSELLSAMSPILTHLKKMTPGHRIAQCFLRISPEFFGRFSPKKYLTVVS
jgi:hypothetical protein